MLTGVYPMHDICSDDKAGKAISSGHKPFLDPRWMNRSFAEAELVKVINLCWHRHPATRLSAGQLVLKLREAVSKNRLLLAKGSAKLES